MKKICLWLLLVLWPCMALGEHSYPTQEDRFALAKLNLTEVYGWNNYQTDDFVFEEVEQDGLYTVRYWPADHPDWIYEQSFLKDTFVPSPAPGGTTPFYTGYEGYPGENSVRGIMNIAEQEGWFANWNEQSRKAFAKTLNEWNITLSAEGLECLADENSGAAEMVHYFFEACYGDDSLWPKALIQWRDDVLSSSNLKPAALSEIREGVWEYDVERYRITRFYGQTPPELQNLTEGWECLSGVMWRFHQATDGVGAVVLGKGEERVLAIIRHKSNNTGWEVESMLPGVLLPGETPIVQRETNGGFYRIQYPQHGLQVKASFVGSFWQIDQLELIQNGTGFRFADRSVTFFENGGVSSSEPRPELPAQYLNYLVLEDVLAKGAEALQPALYEPSDRIAITGNVHLREKTSSHSKDLGMFRSETFAVILGTEEGDPDFWYHVRIGHLEGYMSSHYTTAFTEAGMSVTPLQVGYAKEAADLRMDTGWFASTIRRIQPGETMHILAERGKWYYVCIPKEGPAGRWMDMEGEYGFVLQDALEVGATSQQLIWQNQ